MKLCSVIWFFIFFSGFTCLVQATEKDSDTSIKEKEAKNAQKIQKFNQESECSRVGGTCIASSDCLPEGISNVGSCPTQSEKGAVCCHSLSLSETVCHKLGGSCRESCPQTLIIARANDCDGELKCCPLV